MPISVAVCRLRSCRQVPDGTLSALVSPFRPLQCVALRNSVNVYEKYKLETEQNRF